MRRFITLRPNLNLKLDQKRKPRQKRTSSHIKTKEIEMIFRVAIVAVIVVSFYLVIFA